MTGIWSGVGNDKVIYAFEGNDGGALTDMVSGAYEGTSYGGGVFPVSGHADVHNDCPGYSQHSWPYAFFLVNGDSGGGGDDDASRPC